MLKLLRVNHYIKNLIVFIPLIFSANFFNIKLFCFSLIACFAFCFVSSSVYILNDIADKDTDKLHPIKRQRPIASGSVSIKFAVFLLVLLLILSGALALFLNYQSFLIILSYFVLNIFYSFYLKNIALIDAVSIALGFILRILAGCSAIMVEPSALVILLTFFVSMFFTYSKRKLEFKIMQNKHTQRKSLETLSLDAINQFILINAGLSVAFYLIYVLDETTIQKTNAHFLYLSAIPFSVIIFRLLFLINTAKNIDDPIYFIEKDRVLKILFVVYFLVLGIVMNV